MTPGTHCYFDYYQADPATEPLAIGGLVTLEKVYSFNPVPSGLTAAESKHILGAQGNLWTEYIDSPEKAEYMAYPRAIALAEVLWTPAAQRNWPEFAQRLNQHSERLDGLKVHYAKHLNDPSARTISDENGLQIIWSSTLPSQPVYFSRDTTSGSWTKVDAGDTTLISEAGPVFYKTDFSKIRQINYQPSKARLAKITSNPLPDPLYPGDAGIRTITNGLTGTIHFNGKEWCGWRGEKFAIDLQFPGPTRVDSVRISFLSTPGSWIHNPLGIEISGSADNLDYRNLASWESKPLEDGRYTITLATPDADVKQLIIYVLPLLSIPEGQPGAGKAAWTFIDEISIY
jgi:hexosaminidase